MGSAKKITLLLYHFNSQRQGCCWTLNSAARPGGANSKEYPDSSSFIASIEM